MATLANIFNIFQGARSIADANANTAPRTLSDDYKLRSFPNEQIFFYTKTLDNSRVVRLADPKARTHDLKTISGFAVAACLLIGFLAPGAYSYMEGYRISQLEQENQRLVIERARLELEESSLMSAERLRVLADQQQFIDPTPDQTVYLPKPGEALALNRR